MNHSQFDIDIDVFDRAKVLQHFEYVNASQLNKDNVLVKHNVGIYVQPIPADPIKNMSVIDYNTAEELGYFKIDILNNTIYQGIETESELDRLMNIEPVWELLLDQEFCSKIAHIGNWHHLIVKMKPQSVDELAMFLAVIRPAFSHMQGRAWDDIEKVVWEKPTNGEYGFKKSHSFSYALSIVVQINKLSGI